MKFFVEDFDKFCVKRKSSVQKNIDRILKIFYNDIKLCDDYVNILSKRLFLNSVVKEIKTPKDIPRTHLFDSKYMPDNVKLYITNTAVGYFKMSTWMHGKIKINIYFLLFNKNDFNNLKKIEKKLEEALKIIRFCSLYMKKDDLDSLNIYLYLSKINKELPKNPLNVLDENHCNSAVTFACQEKGELLIFREEEWKKVLLHELFHCMCLDFSGINTQNLKKDIKKLFDVKSDFEMSEAYTEFWATIINSCFISYKLLDDKYDINSFFLFSEFCIQFEKIFSLFQCVKILNYMGLRYENLFKNDAISISFRKILYKENTNVLSYYIIKTILLYYSDDFLQWCLLNNPNIIGFDKTPLTLKKFGSFIEKKYDKQDFVKIISQMELIFIKIRGKYTRPNRSNIARTSRMTICEFDI